MENKQLVLNPSQMADLTAAAAALGRLRKSLDTSAGPPCGECGRRSNRNYTEYRFDQVLAGVLNKLTRAAIAGTRRKESVA